MSLASSSFVEKASSIVRVLEISVHSLMTWLILSIPSVHSLHRLSSPYLYLRLSLMSITPTLTWNNFLAWDETSLETYSWHFSSTYGGSNEPCFRRFFSLLSVCRVWVATEVLTMFFHRPLVSLWISASVSQIPYLSRSAFTLLAQFGAWSIAVADGITV